MALSSVKLASVESRLSKQAWRSVGNAGKTIMPLNVGPHASLDRLEVFKVANLPRGAQGAVP